MTEAGEDRKPYVVLFRPRTRSARFARKDLGISIDEERLSVAEATAKARHPDVALVAPAMPTALVEPIFSSDLVESAGTTWGVRAVGAERSPYSGVGITVAVLDTGIDASHECFRGCSVEQRNFTSGEDGDSNGHGTHVAGTVFGRSVSGCRIGVAPGVKRALVAKVIGDGGTTASVAKAMLWALENGAQVISMSLTIDVVQYVATLEAAGFPSDHALSAMVIAYQQNWTLMERIAAVAAVPGIGPTAAIIVAAAGNASRRHLSPRFVMPAGLPAASDRVVSVGALERTELGMQVAAFSNIGVRISAPGVDVISAKAGGGLATKSGTSMATPHVAGVAALWAEKLIAMGDRDLRLLSEKTIGSASLGGVLNPAALDVGAGIASAPSD